MKIKLLHKVEFNDGGWSRAVMVTGSALGAVRCYRVQVERDGLRGKWVGSVWYGERIYQGDVPAGMSAKALLIRAGVLTKPRGAHGHWVAPGKVG